MIIDVPKDVHWFYLKFGLGHIEDPSLMITMGNNLRQFGLIRYEILSGKTKILKARICSCDPTPLRWAQLTKGCCLPTSIDTNNHDDSWFPSDKIKVSNPE